MSLSLRRLPLRRTATTLACALMVAASSACYHRSSAVDQPSPVAARAVANGYDATVEVRARRFPGVDVIRTRRGGFFVRIHSGLVGAGEPLYVIDGSPVSVEPTRGIDWIPLEDVAQIRVLKNPSETAVYGPRGVNGVIVITTKQARGRSSRGR